MRQTLRNYLLLLTLSLPVFADNWPQFRGPNGGGVAEAQGLPAEIGPDTNMVWKVEVPPGKSSPVVLGDRLYVTAYDGEERLVVCLDRATGREVWRRGLTAARSDKRHRLNDAASPSAATDGEHIYAMFAEFGLISYTAGGEERWRTPLGPFKTAFGLSASPILVDGKVILVADQTAGSYVAAFDSGNGEMLWKTERPDGPGAYATPVLHQADKGPQIIVSGQRELAAYSVSNGKKLWWVSGFAKLSKGSPVAANGRIFVNVKGVGEFTAPFEEWLKPYDTDGDGTLRVSDPENERGRNHLKQMDANRDGVISYEEYQGPIDADAAAGAVWGIRADGEGDVTDTHVMWRYTKALPNVPSPVFYRDVVYVVRNGGIVTSLDPATGEVLKQGRIPEAMDHYYASPSAADGKIYTATETGKVSVLEAGPEWKVLSTGDLGEPIYASPAIAGKFVYVRTDSSLLCFGKD